MSTPDLQIDVNSMTINEIIEFETLAGTTWAEFIDAAGEGHDTPLGVMLRMYRALLYIQQRRTDPTITIEQAGNISVGDIDRIQVVASPATPTSGGALKAEE